MRTPETDPEKIKARKERNKEYLRQYYVNNPERYNQKYILKKSSPDKIFKYFVALSPEHKNAFINLLSEKEYI